eukprot:2591701-Rhodomonas_salina.1
MVDFFDLPSWEREDAASGADNSGTTRAEHETEEQQCSERTSGCSLRLLVSLKRLVPASRSGKSCAMRESSINRVLSTNIRSGYSGTKNRSISVPRKRASSDATCTAFSLRAFSMLLAHVYAVMHAATPRTSQHSAKKRKIGHVANFMDDLLRVHNLLTNPGYDRRFVRTGHSIQQIQRMGRQLACTALTHGRLFCWICSRLRF